MIVRKLIIFPCRLPSGRRAKPLGTLKVADCVGVGGGQGKGAWTNWPSGLFLSNPSDLGAESFSLSFIGISEAFNEVSGIGTWPDSIGIYGIFLLFLSPSGLYHLSPGDYNLTLTFIFRLSGVCTLVQPRSYLRFIVIINWLLDSI